jgi:2-keto-4-pentenoate hydratase
MDPTSGADLAAARLSGVKGKTPDGAFPGGTAAAYAAQDAMIETLGFPIAGWKAAATSTGVQRLLNTDGPFCGALLAPFVAPASDGLAVFQDGMNVMELEIAFRMARDFVPTAGKIDREILADTVESAHPAIEIVDRRLDGGFNVDATWLIADMAANHAFTYGPGRTDWRDLNLAAARTRAERDGEEIGTGRGADALGGPFEVLVWLAGALRDRGRHLKAGDWVTTGILAPIFSAGPGSRIRGEIEGLGTIDLSLRAA